MLDKKKDIQNGKEPIESVNDERNLNNENNYKNDDDVDDDDDDDDDDEDEENQDDPFLAILEKAGNHGRFQTLFNVIFITGLSAASSLIYMNVILALNTPLHWCTVPGREHTNFTLDEWRYMTLPNETDNRGRITHSKCYMYDLNSTAAGDWNFRNSNSIMPNIIPCQFGWSYDKTWYENTISSQQDWVCQKDFYVTNSFVLARFAEVLGSLIFGQMGDIFGRRFVYYIGILFCAIGRIATILSTHSYALFLIFIGVVGLVINSPFQSPQIIGMEISREDDRSRIAFYQSIGWSIGTSTMPLLFWYLRDWYSYMWITSLPITLIFLFSGYVIESPRWLIGKGRYREAIVQFKKIARINGREFKLTESELALIYANAKQDMTYGIASLFAGFRLARNTIITGFSWCAVAVSYFTITLYSTELEGNPFLNYLLQNIVEVPAYIIGKYVGDTYGRRITNSLSFLLSFLTCIPIIYVAVLKEYHLVMVCLTAFIKFLNAVTFFTTSLQSLEIYPTCMRQTGIAFGTLLASAVGIMSPYFVYLGTHVDIRAPYIILGILFLLGSIGAAFLPETLHKKLPDTMEEAEHFGRHDKFFSLPRPLVAHVPEADSNTMKLNQSKFAP